MTKLLNVNSLLWLALVLALAGSLRHLAEMFASIDGNLVYGYLSAIAVDAGLFSLSYSVKLRKAEKRPVKMLWLGIVIFTGISVYGNLSYGLLATGEALPYWILVSRPVILAASLPILVLYLAELVSDNRQFSTEQADKEARRLAKEATKNPTDSQSVNDFVTSIDKARQAKTDKLSERRDKVLTLLQQGEPEADIADRLNVSVRTIQRDIEALNGQVTT